MKIIFVLLTTLVVSLAVNGQTPPGNHVILDGSTQYLSFSTPVGTTGLYEVSSRMVSARLGHATDQVLFDWTGVGTLYIKAVSAGTTNLQFVPATGTGTTTVNITAFTTGFIYRFRYDDIGPNMAYILEAWDSRGDPKTVVSSIVTASVSSIDPNNRTVRIGAKLDATLHLQANIDFWRWHQQWIPHYPVTGEPGGQSPYPTFAKNWLACYSINGNEDFIDYRFENNLTNSGQMTAVLTGTGSPTFAANSNAAPTAVGEDLTAVAKGRIPLSATKSYDYDSSGLVPTNLSDTLSSNWTCVSAPGAGCGAVTIRQPTRLFTWADGATTVGTYTFTVGVTDGSLTDTDTVTIDVTAVSASIPDVNCFVDEPCLLDASASAGWDRIHVNTGETIPGSMLKYDFNISRSVHRYHSAGSYTAIVTAYDAQTTPTTASDTATVTVTARAEANAANTEDLTSPANANHISVANCTSDAAGNTVKVQAALDIAKGRNTVPQKVIVPKGCRADGTVTLKAPVGSEMITLISSGILPAGHKRITPAETAEMFTIRANVVNDPAVTTDLTPVVHHYKLRGVIFEASVNQFTIVNLGQPTVEDSTAEIAHHFVIQHCIFQPTNEFTLNVQNSIIYNANDVSIIDSHFAAISTSGIESHNTLSYSNEGRHVVNNNYLGGASINLFYGGAVSTVRGMVPRNIEIRENYNFKPLVWEPSHPSWDGKVRGMKNLWELKTGSNIVTQGNKLENNWTDAQQGICCFIQATCDSGNWAMARDIDWSYNHILNSEQGMEFRSGEYRGTTQSERVWFNHNLTETLTLRGYLFLQASKVRMNHNTALAVSSQSGIMDGEMRTPGFVYENGIAYEGTFGWFGSGFSTGTPSLNVYFPGFIFRDSLQVGGNSANYTSPVSGMQFPANEAAVAFTNAAGGVWSLSAGSTFKGDANDGTDPGVNWPDLQSHLLHTVDGNWTTTLTLMTANLQHGQGTDNAFNFQRQVDEFTEHAVDIVAVQERGTTETGWNSAMSSAGYSQAVYLENNPTEGDGPAIWVKTATVTVDQVYTRALTTGTNPSCGSANVGWDCTTDVRKSAVAAKVTAASRQFYVVSVHGCWSRCNNSSGTTLSLQRENQMNDLISWIASTLTGGLEIVILGDMNFGPDYAKTTGGLIKDIFTASYTDLWNAGIAAGTATANWGDRNSDSIADMPVADLTTRTHDTRRIDYIFLLTSATGLSLNSIDVPDARATCPHALVAGGAMPSCSPEVVGGPGVSQQQWDIPDDFGVRPSDHNFVKVVLNVSPGTVGITTCKWSTSPPCQSQ